MKADLLKTIAVIIVLIWMLASLCAWSLFSPVDESARDTPEYRHAMQSYRSSHTNCAWCSSTKKLEVHHIQPLWLNPDLAADTNNYIMLCRNDHLYLGHAGNFGRRAVTNIREICVQRIIVERSK